jgi:hypothetical protein
MMMRNIYFSENMTKQIGSTLIRNKQTGARRHQAKVWKVSTTKNSIAVGRAVGRVMMNFYCPDKHVDQFVDQFVVIRCQP